MTQTIKILATLLFTVQCFVANGQIISQFDWDADPVTDALIGPDAISVSGSAISDVDGAGGTNGLNSGLPKLNIDLVLEDDVLFDVDGIDFSIDYQRD